ncbi:hypothetical protein Q75_02960 [Bacillus coahuilensis p1.1.43]|uniref:Uncharacterized protein n=1 Tax=Bacillus coahuilensis p1.1.43 TaxID=1150625 RepID=A0A147KB99_9BACI|nr:hypothetical protein [Bacillus coahuilensis]KUP08310.1 hypothetical protein Q75_02960 [Bacillus coahuilensis p1.1.43]
MNEIFTDYGIAIHEKDGRYFYTTDSGWFVSRDVTFEITKAEAEKAQLNAQEAYIILMKYERLGKYKF